MQTHKQMLKKVALAEPIFGLQTTSAGDPYQRGTMGCLYGNKREFNFNFKALEKS